MTLLPDGNVLISGGFDSLRNTYFFGDYEQTYDIFYSDIGETDWRDAPWPVMLNKRYMHGATLLPDGRVLLSGGFNHEDKYLSACDLYDAAGDSCLAAAPMAEPRMGHGAILLDDGRILVAGNTTGRMVETCTPGGEWTLQHDLLAQRHLFSATVFANDVVLIVGGVDETVGGNGGFLTSCELYVP